MILDVFVPGSPVARPSGKLDLIRRRPGLKAWMELVAMLARVNRRGPLFDGPVELEVELEGARRGDLSNFVKAIEDALNGNAWKDDRQVRRIRAQFVITVPSRGPGALIRVRDFCAACEPARDTNGPT